MRISFRAAREFLVINPTCDVKAGLQSNLCGKVLRHLVALLFHLFFRFFDFGFRRFAAAAQTGDRCNDRRETYKHPLHYHTSECRILAEDQ